MLTGRKLWQFEFYVININPLGSLSRRTFHMSVCITGKNSHDDQTNRFVDEI